MSDLEGDSKWPGLDGGEQATEFDFHKMRKIADDLEEYFASMTGAAFAEGYTTGSVASIQNSSMLSVKEIGSWPAASVFADAVGSGSLTRYVAAPGSQGNPLVEVYGLFVTRYQEVIKAIRDSADAYERAEHANGG